MKKRERTLCLSCLLCTAVLLFSLVGCGQDEPDEVGPGSEAAHEERFSQEWFKSLPKQEQQEFYRQFQKHNGSGFDQQWWADWFDSHREDEAYQDFFNYYGDDWSDGSDDELDDLLDLIFGDDDGWEDDEYYEDDWDADSWFFDIFGDDDWEDDDWYDDEDEDWYDEDDDWYDEDEDWDDDEESWGEILFDW